MKKVGKNNPKAEQIEADNRVRTMWNQNVDRALVSGVPEEQILEVKQSDIVNIGLHFFLKNVRPYAASCSEV